MDSPSPDQPVLHSSRQRPSEILRQAFVRYQDELFGMLYFLTGGVEQATVAIQETFSKCWMHRHHAVEKPNLKAWIFHLALGTARDRRHAAKHKLSTMDEAEATRLTDRTSPPADSQMRRRLIQMRQAVSLLSSQDREILLLRQNGAMSYEEISRSLNLPVSTVKVKLRAALAKIREAIH